MEKEEIGVILAEQRKFFLSGATRDTGYRLSNLKKLRSLILKYENEIKEALNRDFHKPEFETVATETRFVLAELNYTIRNLKKWSGRRRVKTPLVHFPAHSYVLPQPYGQVLVMSPWNFPFQLSMLPAMGALAAGNCVALKVSQQVPETGKVIEKILSNFPGALIAVFPGDHSVSEYLLDYKFDYIFFTGSPRVGRHIMEKASVNLTPISLELGGKNPCVVAADAKLNFAATRIAWGKFINAGQTCVAPDYLLIDSRIKDRFLEILSAKIRDFYGENPEESKDFARVISTSSAERLTSLMKSGKIAAGGTANIGNRYVAPTIIKDVKPGDPVMLEEIFGPILPVIEYQNIEEVYSIIEKNPKPLATYIFTRNKKLVRSFLARTESGSASINDTVMQIASPYLPYGGIGPSGIGRYHGRKSFETFSNMRSVLVKSNLVDIFARYPPYTNFKENIIKLLLR
jgi:aldehyde dehydrogenase (NAD+)